MLPQFLSLKTLTHIIPSHSPSLYADKRGMTRVFAADLSVAASGSPGPGSTSASSVVDSSVSGDWDVWDEEDDYMVSSVLKKKISKLSKQLKK